MIKPFFHSFTLIWPHGDKVFSDTVTIPAEKLLIVEFVSVFAWVPTGQSVTTMNFHADDANHHSLVWYLVGRTGSLDYFVASQQTHMYVTASFRFELTRYKTLAQIPSAQAGAVASITGQLINAS